MAAAEAETIRELRLARSSVWKDDSIHSLAVGLVTEAVILLTTKGKISPILPKPNIISQTCK
ncbi:hypothetical protein KSP39_PZI007243 [Platanthera zijinensis]|uniref:Uncharacterized protein n=1 Tax=Platanthera zijinensis TaxID=2320716 RepID=A0AAP0BQ79_9ASPA